MRKPMTMRRLFVLAAALGLLSGCAHQRPVLYPNAALQQRGQTAGNRAIDACMQRAEAAGLDYSKGRVVRRTVKAGALGGAGGAVGGAIYGHAGRGAAAGAAGSATAGLLSALFSRDDPAPIYRAYVNRCLAGRGYDPVGWQ